MSDIEIKDCNPGDQDWTRRVYVVALGTYGWTQLRIWADSEDDAIEEAASWCADNAPGLLCDKAVQEEYDRAIAEGKSEEEAQEEALIDVISCDRGHYLPWWEVNFWEEKKGEHVCDECRRIETEYDL